MKRLHLPPLLLAALLVFWQLPLAAQTTAPAKPAFREVMADQELLARLQKGGYVLYLRHGYTDNSRADQFPNVDLADLIGFFVKPEGTVVVFSQNGPDGYAYVASIPPTLWDELLGR